MDLEHSQACDGQFEEEYQPIKAIGKGAFGFVWKAIQRCDEQEVRNDFYLCYVFNNSVLNAYFYAG